MNSETKSPSTTSNNETKSASSFAKTDPNKVGLAAEGRFFNKS